MLDTKEEYEAYLANNRKQTVEELREWLKEMKLFITRCDCTGYSNCQGWRINWDH